MVVGVLVDGWCRCSLEDRVGGVRYICQANDRSWDFLGADIDIRLRFELGCTIYTRFIYLHSIYKTNKPQSTTSSIQPKSIPPPTAPNQLHTYKQQAKLARTHLFSSRTGQKPPPTPNTPTPTPKPPSQWVAAATTALPPRSTRAPAPHACRPSKSPSAAAATTRRRAPPCQTARKPATNNRRRPSRRPPRGTTPGGVCPTTGLDRRESFPTPRGQGSMGIFRSF